MIKICKCCGKEFKTSHKESVNCSRACRNKANPIIYTEERKEKHKIACKGINKGSKNPAYGKFGKDSWTYGTKRSEEIKLHFSKTRKGKYVGDKNPSWKGGISNEGYPLEWNKDLKIRIKNRDNHICFICKNKGSVVHHIDYDKQNCLEINLITLCGKCHPKTNYKRQYWIEFFKTNILLTDGIKV